MLFVDPTAVATAAPMAAVATAHHHLATGWTAHLAAVKLPNLQPDPGDLPGGNTIQKLVDGLGAWALIAALAGLVIGAAAWALGAHSQNYHQSFVGRKTVLISAVAALLIGAAPVIVGFFYHAGTTLH